MASQLTHFGFQKSAHDHCMYTQGSITDEFLAIVLYVDDLLITGTSEKKILQLKEFLHNAFIIKDMGAAKYFLGIEMARSEKGMLLSQTKYISDLIKEVRFEDANTVKTPLPPGFQPTLASPYCKNLISIGD